MAAEVAGDADGPFSSTRVRDAVAAGDVAARPRVLGRPHALSGIVEHGDARGRTLGFPTANLGGVEEMLPAYGVYAVRVHEEPYGRDPSNGGVMNIGVRPTVGGMSLRIEAHLFDFDQDLYGSGCGSTSSLGCAASRSSRASTSCARRSRRTQRTPEKPSPPPRRLSCRSMDRGELEGLDRESLVVRAQAAGIRRARILTRPELIDELLRLDPSVDESAAPEEPRLLRAGARSRARVVERGLHLPDAADRIRTLAGGLDAPPFAVPRTEPQAMPTVTLAEIYAAQGHRKRAIETLRRVLEREPEHVAAQSLLAAPRGRTLRRAAAAAASGARGRARAESARGDERSQPKKTLTVDEADAVAFVEAKTLEIEHAGRTLRRRALVRATRTGSSFTSRRRASAMATPGRRSARTPPMPSPAAARHRATYAIIGCRGQERRRAGRHGDQRCRAAEVERRSSDVGRVLRDPSCGAGGRMYVRWRVSFSRLGAQLGARPGGRFVVRAHVVTPSWDGPSAETRDSPSIPTPTRSCSRACPSPRWCASRSDGSTGRRSSRWRTRPRLEITARAAASRSGRPEGAIPVSLDDPRAASIARAFEGSRRAVEAQG